jgi:hypothetical protein
MSNAIRRALGAAAAAMLFAATALQPGQANAGGGFHGGGGFHRGGFHGGFHGGGFHGGGIGPGAAVGLGLGAFALGAATAPLWWGPGWGYSYPWWGYGYPYSVPPYYGYAPAASYPAYGYGYGSQPRYWCSSPAGYYPDVTQCPGGWRPY